VAADPCCLTIPERLVCAHLRRSTLSVQCPEADIAFPSVGTWILSKCEVVFGVVPVSGLCRPSTAPVTRAVTASSPEFIRIYPPQKFGSFQRCCTRLQQTRKGQGSQVKRDSRLSQLQLAVLVLSSNML
jgi:hypothetical protein